MSVYEIYYPGLTYIQREDKQFTSAVDPDGPAYKAGIRNDMEVVSTNSVNRFSNAWCFCPIQLTVKAGGKLKTITYVPKGKKIRISQYQKAYHKNHNLSQ